MAMYTVKSRNQRRVILRCLTKLRKGEGRDEHMGICGSIDRILHEQDRPGVSYGPDGMELLFKGWRDGLHDNTAWPINAEYTRLHSGSNWYPRCGRWEGLKLELRLELIDHAIRKLHELGV